VSLQEPFLKKDGMSICREDEAQKGWSVNGAVVREKAKQLNNHYAKLGGTQKHSFHASKGWFTNCKKQVSLQHRNRIQELSFADRTGEAKYPEHFKKIIEDQHYLPQQIFKTLLRQASDLSTRCKLS
jgi:hypothetical protein